MPVPHTITGEFMTPMACSDYLTILNIIIAILGILFVLLTIYEYWKLRTLRAEFDSFRQLLADERYRSQQASHRLIACYQLKDPAARISLATSATVLDPDAFNAWNIIGWAWLELNEPARAVESFREATRRHPADKSGYFDLATAYLRMNSPGLALDALEQAVSHDETARLDLPGNELFLELHDQPRFMALLAP